MTSQQDPQAAPTAPSSPKIDFSVLSQSVELDVDFLTRSLTGKTEIVVAPNTADLATVRLNCRQCEITRVTVEDKVVAISTHPFKAEAYLDPYKDLGPSRHFSVYQHHVRAAQLRRQLKYPPEPELAINLPKSIRIVPLDPSSTSDLGPKSAKSAGDDGATLETPIAAATGEQSVQYAPLKIKIEYRVKRIRDGLQFVGFEEGDGRYPHVYTQNSPLAGRACTLFPCVDSVHSRCPFDFAITSARTLGDAFKRSNGTADPAKPGKGQSTASRQPEQTQEAEAPEYLALSEEDRALELLVLGPGDMTDEIVNPKDPSRKTTYFSCATAVSPNQIGFVIAPFEEVDLSSFREVDDDDKLGANAIPVVGFCLPGRAEEVKNACMPLAKAIDFCTTTFTTFPFPAYKLCFVDDLEFDVADAAALSICSNRLLFPEDIVEPIDSVTRILVRAVTIQYAGISIAPKEPSDSWAIVGMAGFMADLFMKHLSGNNEYRYQQKLAADLVCDLDIQRLSLSDLGKILYLDKSEADFLSLKAGVVLFILDRRLAKTSGSAGITRILTRLLTNAKNGSNEDTLLQTATFVRMCEKIGHVKLETFFEQWVHGAGCPEFQITQRFNKKKLVVEMLIKQVHIDRANTVRDLNPETFIRDVKEEAVELYVPPLQVFTGPMTIRIHEADGTPYEHIVEIKDATTKFEIPYNTKYKRLKRNRRHKEQATTAPGVDASAETQDDVLLYCLGDTLQSPEEAIEWRLTDWSKDDEDKMSQESYEWIRIDADFEWICRARINMPPYMFVSQLQQDRDVVAQVQTLQYMATQVAHPLISTILVRTLMDKRYFHGIRTMAAMGLAKCARDELDWIGLFHLERAFQEFFCFPDSQTTRSNDFSNRITFLIQCAIPKAIATIKDNAGEAPMRVKRFFVDKLKFNDNSTNEYSDCHYIATLMSGLAETLIRPKEHRMTNTFGDDDEEEDLFQGKAIEDIERYRRIDEYISSYQNVFSLTALDCLVRLALSKVIKPNLTHFLKYVRVGNSDVLRIKALECLVELGQLKNPAIMNYALFAFSVDNSPYFRQNILRILGKGLGRIAIGGTREDAEIQASSGLIVEQEASIEGRQADFARKQTIEGATEALKIELADNETLQKALAFAIGSTSISLHEVGDLLEFCALIYEPKTELKLILPYPRYWKVEHLGNALMKFTKTNRIRLKPLAKWTPQGASQKKPAPLHLPAPAKSQRASPAAERKHQIQGSGGRILKSGSTSPPPPRKPTILKLKSMSQSQTPTISTPSPAPSLENAGRRLSLKFSKPNGTIGGDTQPNAISPSAAPPAPSQGWLGQSQMSPPPRPSSAASVSSSSSAALSTTRPGSASAPKSKKRKSSESETPQQPLAKRPTLKLNLSSFKKAAGSKGGQATTPASQGGLESPAPPQ